MNQLPTLYVKNGVVYLHVAGPGITLITANSVELGTAIKEWVSFFWGGGGFMGNESERGTNKSREPGSGSRTICLFRDTIHSRWTQKIRTLIPYIYNVSNKDPS